MYKDMGDISRYKISSQCPRHEHVVDTFLKRQRILYLFNLKREAFQIVEPQLYGLLFTVSLRGLVKIKFSPWFLKIASSILICGEKTTIYPG